MFIILIMHNDKKINLWEKCEAIRPTKIEPKPIPKSIAVLKNPIELPRLEMDECLVIMATNVGAANPTLRPVNIPIIGNIETDLIKADSNRLIDRDNKINIELILFDKMLVICFTNNLENTMLIA